jgi:glutamate formiminotransferase/formiminotetrahydrofolate cyclodeaminase
MSIPVLVECVPNFSEGRDASIIQQITSAIESVDGVSLLHVDPGKATNRTVVTFVGAPAPVIEAAFRAIKIAGELIDMRGHQGAHPRMGATDVCPLIPVSGITMEETVAWAQKLAERVGTELQLPVYLYEEAQPNKQRSNLSVIRAGEYEGFAQKIQDPVWKPDYGPQVFDLKRGATVIGARDFLIAYNVNLNTTSTRRANAVAFDVREAGRVQTENGKPVLDATGNKIQIPGSLKSVKAIGWFIEEYGFAQISMNLTNIRVTPLHIAFDEVCKRAAARGLRVTGSELVGLVPLQTLLDAGRYFLEQQQRSIGVSEEELIRTAVRTLGLEELGPFDLNERIIEYRLAKLGHDKLVRMSLRALANETASESPAPGGGSISAAVGALGVALGTMVANLSSHKRGWDDQWNFFSSWAAQGQALKDRLLVLVDEDTRAFDAIMQAMALPKSTESEKTARREAMQQATRYAIEVPLQVMETAMKALPLIEAMVERGNPNSLSDAGVGLLCLQTAVLGAGMNVRINTQGLADTHMVEQALAQAATWEAQVGEDTQRLLGLIYPRLTGE